MDESELPEGWDVIELQQVDELPKFLRQDLNSALQRIDELEKTVAELKQKSHTKDGYPREFRGPR